jgi:RNA polymerase sigma-70 factor, ECF subfamily
MAKQAEFLEMFLKHEGNLRAFVAAVVKNCEDREDVFQETVLVLWQKHDEYDGSRPFGAWARGIAAKKVLQYRTKSGRIPTAFSPETINVIVDALERRELQEPKWSTALDALEKCAQKLPDQSRELLGLRYKEGWGVGKIAEYIGSTPAALTMTFTRLRTRLQTCVGQLLNRQSK